jgi:curved DNA-binding protein CbpA
MYFNSPQTLEDLKRQYRELSLKHHPDKGGDTATMQAINAEYEQLFRRLKDVHRAADGEVYTASKPSDETAEQFIHVIDVLMKLDGVIIEICGRFVWLSGNTKIYKDVIKDLGFRWSTNKTAWYLAPRGYRRRSRHDWTMADIRARFGSEAMMSAGSTKIDDSMAA